VRIAIRIIRFPAAANFKLQTNAQCFQSSVDAFGFYANFIHAPRLTFVVFCSLTYFASCFCGKCTHANYAKYTFGGELYKYSGWFFAEMLLRRLGSDFCWLVSAAAGAIEMFCAPPISHLFLMKCQRLQPHETFSTKFCGEKYSFLFVSGAALEVFIRMLLRLFKKMQPLGCLSVDFFGLKSIYEPFLLKFFRSRI